MKVEVAGNPFLTEKDYAAMAILPSMVAFTGWGSEPMYDTSASRSTGPYVRFVPFVKTV